VRAAQPEKTNGGSNRRRRKRYGKGIYEAVGYWLLAISLKLKKEKSKGVMDV
jgi:hypothetical protein